MHLALGIDADMPDIPSEIIDYNIPDWLPSVFPGRTILVWHSDSGEFAELRSSKWNYQGNCYELGDEADGYLVAFCYGDATERIGHCVIGEPTSYHPGVDILLVFAVSI